MLGLKPPGAEKTVSIGTLGSDTFATMTPGSPPWILPEGTAKYAPAGFRFLLTVHYVTTGSPQTDQTRIGFILREPKHVKREAATKLIADPNLEIPPHAANHRVVQTLNLKQDVLLLAMFPHMHYRGKSIRYEAVYPNGAVETLLDVPRYDFGWQHRYVLAEPKRLPADSTVRCTAVYDNSENNPANPDPNVVVRTGEKSTDEMFNAYVDLAPAEQDLTLEPSVWDRLLRLETLAGLLAVGLLLWFARRSQPSWRR
jgi:hypothetical protein